MAKKSSKRLRRRGGVVSGSESDGEDEALLHRDTIGQEGGSSAV